MSRLSIYLKDYLSLRDGLGFKMKDARRDLPKFVSFLDRRRAPSIDRKSVV